MNIVVNNKELPGGVRKMELSVSGFSSSLKPGNCVLVRVNENCEGIFAIVGEVKNEKISLYISPKYSKRVSDLIVGDRILKLSGGECHSFEKPFGSRITVLAENDSAYLLYPLLKQLYKQGVAIQLLLISSDHKETFYLKHLQKYSSIVKRYEIERNSMKMNSVAKVLLDYVDSFDAEMLYAFGNVFTVKETYQYLSCRPGLHASVVLDATTDFNANIKGLYSVSMSRKSKYFTVEGLDFYAVYRTPEEMIGRFDLQHIETTGAYYSKTQSV
jgi:hypothetical protein